MEQDYHNVVPNCSLKLEERERTLENIHVLLAPICPATKRLWWDMVRHKEVRLGRWLYVEEEEKEEKERRGILTLLNLNR